MSEGEDRGAVQGAAGDLKRRKGPGEAPGKVPSAGQRGAREAGGRPGGGGAGDDHPDPGRPEGVINLSGHSRRTQILISLLLLEAARKYQLKERLDAEAQAMQYLCRADGMFAELITPLWRDPTQMHLHLTREFLWLTVQDTLGRDVGQCIRDVASLAMLTYPD